MTSHTTERFRKAFRELPPHVQHQAREAYQKFFTDPNHPSLQFKQVHATEPIYSARVGIGYRALGVKESKAIVWFWIGPHSEYDKLISRR